MSRSGGARAPTRVSSTSRRCSASGAQAFLFHCIIFGQSLLFFERGPRKRAPLIAQSAEKLLDDSA